MTERYTGAVTIRLNGKEIRTRAAAVLAMHQGPAESTLAAEFYLTRQMRLASLYEQEGDHVGYVCQQDFARNMRKLWNWGV